MRVVKGPLLLLYASFLSVKGLIVSDSGALAQILG